jgi:hypothetical protein
MRTLVILLCLAVCLIQIGAVERAEAGPGAKVTSAPPLTPVNDLAFDATNFQTLTWTYCVNGDYDQNGEVGVSDITPVGLHFGKTTASADWETARVADGDGNGEVNASDLTRIGLNFGATVSDFMVLASPSEGGPFVGGAGTIVAFDSAPKPGGGGPRAFEFELTSPVPDNWYCIVARDALGEATDYSNAVQYVLGNLPPEAVMTYLAEPSGPPGFWQMFVGSDSSDPDGSIVEYEWDFEGTGEFVSTGSTPSASHVYSFPGAYSPVLRVTDDGGATGTVEGDQILIDLGQSNIVTLDGSAGSGVGIAATTTVDGMPCAVYTSGESVVDLKAILPQTIEATTWLAPFILDEDTNVGSLSICKGYQDKLRVSCGADGSSLLLYIGSEDGLSWTPSPFTVRASDGPGYGFFTSIFRVIGYGSIAYGDTDQKIWYTYPQDSVFQHVQVSPAGMQGNRPSLNSINGRPCIVYENFTTGSDSELYFLQADDAQGTSWPQPVALVTGTQVYMNQYSLIQLFSGGGLVTYYDHYAQSLRTIATTDYINLTWGAPAVVDNNAVEYAYSTQLVNALPCIAYCRKSTNQLMVVYATDRDGLEWNDPISVSTNGSGFTNIALVQREKYPLIFFHDLDDENLKAAVFRETTP